LVRTLCISNRTNTVGYTRTLVGEKNMNKVKSDGDKTTTLQSDSGALNLFFVEENTW